MDVGLHPLSAPPVIVPKYTVTRGFCISNFYTNHAQLRPEQCFFFLGVLHYQLLLMGHVTSLYTRHFHRTTLQLQQQYDHCVGQLGEDHPTCQKAGWYLNNDGGVLHKELYTELKELGHYDYVHKWGVKPRRRYAILVLLRLSTSLSEAHQHYYGPTYLRFNFFTAQHIYSYGI